MKTLIVCAGDKPEASIFMEEYGESDYKIAVDGGAQVFFENGVCPDLLLGDMDSLSEKTLESFKNSGVEIQKFKPEKDLTDTEIAIRKSIEIRSEHVVLLGCTGGRFDHSYANVLMLHKLLLKGVSGVIKDFDNNISMKDRSFSMIKNKKYASFYSFGDVVEGLTLEGFKYPLKGYRLVKGDPLCTSNEIIRNCGYVQFESGKILVIESENQYT